MDRLQNMTIEKPLVLEDLKDVEWSATADVIELKPAIKPSTLRRYCDSNSADIDWLASHGVPFSGAAYLEKAAYPPEDKFLYYSGNENVAGYREKAMPAPRGHRTVGTGFGLGNSRRHMVDVTCFGRREGSFSRPAVSPMTWNCSTAICRSMDGMSPRSSAWDRSDASAAAFAWESLQAAQPRTWIACIPHASCHRQRRFSMGFWSINAVNVSSTRRSTPAGAHAAQCHPESTRIHSQADVAQSDLPRSFT